MADVITRFKLETTQFDSKLRDSAKSLSNLARHFSLAGKDFDKFAAGSVESARSLGNVATSANNVKDRLKELVGAYNETAKAYNILTKEQQEGDFGKAMAESLQTLKGRITETKQELYGLGDQGKSTGGLMDSLKDKITLNVDAIKLFSLGMSGAKAALNVAKDAFFESETNIDEWGRTVEGAKGAYTIFLDTLNNGNWSNFFNNLSMAIQGSRDLYDAFDRLQSIKSNNAAAIALVQKEIQELRLAKQQGENVDAKLKSATERLAILQKQSVNAGLNAGSSSAFQVIRNGVNSIGGAGLNDATIKYAVGQIMKNGQAEFDKYKYNRDTLRQMGMVSRPETYLDASGRTGVRTVQEFDINKLTKEQQKQYALAQAITEGETRIQQGISVYAQSVQEGASSAREQFRGNRYALQGSGSGGSGGRGTTRTTTPKTESQLNEDEIKKLTAEYQKLYEISKSATGEELVAADDRMTTIKEEIQYLRQRNDALNEWADIALGNANPARVEAGDPRKAGFKLIGGETGIGSMNTQATVEAIRDSAKKAIESVDLADPMLSKFQAVFVDSNALANVMKVALENGLNVDALDFSILRDKIGMGIDIPDETWSELEGKINEMLAGLNIEPIKLNLATGAVQGGKNPVNTAKETADAWDKASQAIQSVGSAMQSIEDPAAKVAGLVAQAIATVASAYAQALATDWTSKSNIWAFIAAAAASTASMISTITAIHKATGYAEGGIIKGNSYSGDNIGGLVDGSQLVGLNAGEIVLNAAQQNSVAGLLQGQAGAPTSTRATISGEQLVIAINNFGRRRGRGELIPL